jgi:tellurite methyltransferase
MSSIADKWNNIYTQQNCEQVTASTVLVENSHLLPSTGKALDLACGLGGNAILLAKHKLLVHAWDVSATALNKIGEYAQSNKLDITTKMRDVEQQPPEKDCFDVVTVSQFLHRATFHNLCECLHMGGILFYQTYTLEKTTQVGPNNPNYLLAKNELLNLCDGMEVLVYREEGVQGNVQQGWRNQAMIVAKRVN